MLTYPDPYTQLDLHHRRADELMREAGADRIARALRAAGRHRRFGRASERPRQVRAPVTP